MVDRLFNWSARKWSRFAGRCSWFGKTLAIKTLSEAVHGAFSRIQFTPDLLPADVIGTQIYNVKENDFSIKKVLFLQILFWRMKSTVLQQKCNLHFWK